MSLGGFFIKQGATLQLDLQVLQDDTTPVNITGWTFFSEIRDQFANLVATPTITITNATIGQLTYVATSNSEWPVGNLKTDIFLDMSGVPFFSQTFMITVGAPVTNPADQS